MTSENWIGVHTGGAHYLDHLGVLCEGLNIPLYVTEVATFKTAQEFYPGLNVEYIDLLDLSPSFLAQRADVIFESGHTFAAELLPLWELLHNKKMRMVYCPHGNSDKKSPQLRKDLSLVYGEHMKCHLKKTGEDALLEKTIVTGNYRAIYSRFHQKWYDEKLESFIEKKIFSDRKTVFYAPTWESPDWFENTLRVIQEVGPDFNLLVRLHPFLEDLYPAQAERIKNLDIIDLSSFPSIYPILRKADYYLGDFSSIGYDFLTLNKPLFFLDHDEGEIYECGLTLCKNGNYGKVLKEFRDNGYFNAKRKELTKRVFGEEKSFESIKNEIKEALSFERASWAIT